ncbi:hypothetical protein KVR01_001169 [Diaporthe batatas]|uniref:uncharacterized protein n=1 Tax=Diaporthe batatas TaxID=748121 RepID=UPI001D05125F|nr:uncharacterized protein KVR01_001169 [Diaporthe batatas]KAG8168420.1 hypothetical protein KVR01_001169 [Diaporthe batatas]
MADRGRGRGRGRGDRAPRGGGPSRGGVFPPDRGGGDRGGYRGGGGRGGKEPPRVYTPRSGVPVPNPQVQDVEDARQKARSAPQHAISSLSLAGSSVMPAQPGYSTAGQPITIFANYVPIMPPSNLTLYSYNVSKVKPNIVGKKRMQTIRLLVNKSPKLQIYQGDMVTNFKSTIIS